MKNYEIASAVIIFFLAWLIPVAVCIWLAKIKDRKWYWFALLAIASWGGVVIAHNIPSKKKALTEAEEKLRKQIEESIKSEAKSEVLASIEASRVGFAKDEEWLIMLTPNSAVFSSLKSNKNFTVIKEKSREKIQIYDTFLSLYNIIVQSPDSSIYKFKIPRKGLRKLRSWFPKAEVIRSSWTEVIGSGFVIGVIAGFTGGQLTFPAWIVCYILFLHRIKPFYKLILTITIGLAIATFLGSILR